MPSRTTETEYKVQVLDRAFMLLNTIANSDASLGSADLGQRLKLNKTTVHRLLAVLERNRFVEREIDTGRYRLGLKLVELGSIALSRFDLNRLAKPFLDRLVAETGETAHLGIWRHNEVVSLVNVEGRYSVRTPATVGRRSPVHCTSQGKVLLAFQTQSFIDEFLRSHRFTIHTRNTIRAGAQFRTELMKVRREGFALDDEEFEEGLSCVAAPIRDHSGTVIAAISIAGPTFRVSADRMPELIKSVLRTAAALSKALGYRQPAGISPAEPAAVTKGAGTRAKNNRQQSLRSS